ncbi:hypothetical protein QFC19_001724 [Naganishia cerealis]|uniref:Uncharacterized protein n=1 Tax=Naganishia cerealis TaxID=610337 RepID=A0ACC2WHM5_9TREE|nr:hypothetical protein QFC19_001724 [Naganishia cerealis]
MCKHAQCSEPFYASAVREAIQSDSASSSDEKRKMMEMLNRFERGDTEGDSGEGSTMNGIEELLKGMGGLSQDDEGRDVEDDDGDGDEDEFEALEALRAQLSDDANLEAADKLIFLRNIRQPENMDMQDLVNLLPPTHRDHFLTLLSNPDSDHVQRLLDSLDESDRHEVESESSPGFLSERQQTEEVEEGAGATSDTRIPSIPESAPAVVPLSEHRDSRLPRARIEEL